MIISKPPILGQPCWFVQLAGRSCQLDKFNLPCAERESGKIITDQNCSPISNAADWSAPFGLFEELEAAGRVLEPAGHTAGHVSSDQFGDFESLLEPAGWTVGGRLQTAMLQQAGCVGSHW